MEQLADKKSIEFMNRDVLKYLALFMMGVGHMIVFIGVGHFGFLPLPVLQFFIAGEMFAPPVFFFFISEGFVHTKSRKKYALRLLVIALITQFPFYLCHFYYYGDPLAAFFTNWNIMTALLLGLLVLMVWECEWKLPLRIFVMLAIVAGSYLINVEWKIFAPVLIFVMYVFREKPVIRYVSCAVILLIHQFICNGFVFKLRIGSFSFFIAEMVAITLITFFYSGKKGHFPRFSKWIFYVFYPAHLLLAYIIKLMLK